MSTSTIAWLTLTQLAAAGMGGYLAGRLRTRWVGLHGDEAFFRDTAHGFLSWAMATLVTAATLTSTITGVLATGAQAGATAAGAAGGAAIPAIAGAAERPDTAKASGYFVDWLFRRDASSAATSAAGTTSPTQDPADKTSAEAGRILASAGAKGALDPDDIKYLGQLVAQRTGMNQADAEKRVSDTFARMQADAKTTEAAARDAADKARKASSYAALWMFVSLLAGAFCASVTATYGGRRRDLF